MKKALKIVAVVLVLGIVTLQFFGIDTTNPPIVDSETLEAAVNVPPDISQILVRSCNDCHTDKTVYPWYANIQPVGWFVTNHIEHGKETLNLSKFATFDTKKKIRTLEEICEEVDAASMPLPSYLWIHRDAVLSESERKVICDWTRMESLKLEQPSS